MLQAWKEKDPEQRIKLAHSALVESQSKYAHIIVIDYNLLHNFSVRPGKLC